MSAERAVDIIRGEVRIMCQVCGTGTLHLQHLGTNCQAVGRLLESEYYFGVLGSCICLPGRKMLLCNKPVVVKEVSEFDAP